MSLLHARDMMATLLLGRDTHGQHKKGSYRRHFAAWDRQDRGQQEDRDAG